MCTSPLLRIRAKYKVPNKCRLVSILDGYSTKTKGYKMISWKKVSSLYPSFSMLYDDLNRYFDYMFIPCRKCDECRMRYARDWSIRNYHEFTMRKVGCFITLTIDSAKAHLFTDDMTTYCKRCVKGNRFIKFPIDYTLCRGLIYDWLKKMRDTLSKRHGVNIRYFGCGEYGSEENSERPHYHILIYGYDFPDKVLFKKSKKGSDCFISEELSKLWPYGIHTIQSIEYGICMYASKYVMKKVKFDGDSSLSEFEKYYGREPEFLFMSKGNCQSNRCKYINEIITNCKGLNSLRNLENPYCKSCDKTRGGLGYDWLCKYYYDVIKLGYIVIEGVKYPIPKYYLDIISLTSPETYAKLKLKNLDHVDELNEEHPEYLSIEHLNVRKKIIRDKLKRTRRE